jgi:hypothetical protein
MERKIKSKADCLADAGFSCKNLDLSEHSPLERGMQDYAVEYRNGTLPTEADVKRRQETMRLLHGSSDYKLGIKEGFGMGAKWTLEWESGREFSTEDPKGYELPTEDLRILIKAKYQALVDEAAYMLDRCKRGIYSDGNPDARIPGFKKITESLEEYLSELEIRGRR